MMFVRDDGIRFHSFDEAWDDMAEWMDDDDFEGCFSNIVSYEKLLKWAKKQDDFWKTFEDEICSAKMEFFENFYSEIEEEEED